MKIITSENISEATRVTIEEARKVATGSLAPTFVIVPDRFTLQAEKMLLGGGTLLNCYVVTFSKLFYILHEEFSGRARCDQSVRVLDKTSAVLYMWRAIKAVKDDLIWFNKSVRHYAFAEAMFNTINQLTSNMVDFAKLASNAVSGSVTSKKMHDIAVIRNKYKELVGGETDSSGQLRFLIDNVGKSEAIKGARFFVAGFDHISVERGAVLGEIFKSAKEITVGARKDSEFDEQVRAICFELGIGNKSQAIVTNSGSRNKGNQEVAVNKVQLDTVQAEASWIVNEICDLVKNHGVRYRDIVVALANYDDTVKMFWQMMVENNIAVNVDVGEHLLTLPLTQYLKEYLALGITGRGEHLVNIIKSSFSGLPAEQEFELENLALKTNIRSHEMVDSVVKRLRKCKTACQYCAVLLGLIPKGEGQDVKKLQELLDVIASAMGDEQISGEDFLNLFCTLASATKFSQIPEIADAITLVGVNEHQPYYAPYLFIAGCDESVFPTRQDDTDIITKQDIANMSCRIEPSAELQNRRNRNHATNILRSAVKGLYLSYTDEQSVLIENLHGTKETQIASKSYAMATVLRAIGDGTAFENALFYNSVLRSLDIGDMQIGVGSNSKIGKARELFFANDTARVTQIENFYKCPYYHFLVNGLKIKPRERYQVAANVMGRIIHKVAEKFTNAIIAKGSLDSFDSVKEMNIVVESVLALKEFGFIGADKNFTPVVSAIRRESKKIADTIVKGIAESEYFPKHTEMSVSKDFGGINLKGVIDRVDCKGLHSIVIDYKTGSQIGEIKLQLPLYLGMLEDKGFVPDGGYYLMLSGSYKDAGSGSVKKGIIKNVKEEIDKANQMAGEATLKILEGCIDRAPNSKKSCEYCMSKASCEVSQ